MCMEKLENLSQNELIELWQQLQSMTQEETRDCGDVALLWHLAKRLDLVNILDQAADKREQGQSVGLLTVPRVREDRLDGDSSWY